MPYASNKSLPAPVKEMSAECQTVFREVFNECYDSGKEERRCYAIAYAAAQEHEASYDDDDGGDDEMMDEPDEDY